MIAAALSPAFSASSSTASLVIDAVTTAPPMSILTCDVVAPRVTSVTLPAGRCGRRVSRFSFAF